MQEGAEQAEVSMVPGRCSLGVGGVVRNKSCPGLG